MTRSRTGFRTRLGRGALPLLAVTLTGCASIERRALRGATDLLAGDAVARVFLSEEDPELVRASLPFALKTNEVLLESDPHNATLLLSLARGYAAYAYAFVDAEAQRLRDEDLSESRTLQARAARLYLRARDYGLRGLSLRIPEFAARLKADPDSTLALTTPEDAPLLYWSAAAWAAAIQADSQSMDRVAELPHAEAMMRRVLALRPDYDQGSVHEFFLRLDGSRSPAAGGDPERARRHFEEAVRLSGGRRASPYVALAETVAVQQQDLELFQSSLQQALAVDVSRAPEDRLANVLAQDKARWLLGRIDYYFLTETEEP